RCLGQVGGDRLDPGSASGDCDCALIRGAQGGGVGGVGAPGGARGQDQVVGVADPDRQVVDEADARSAAVDGDRQQDDHPVLGGGRAAGAGLVGDQVAFAEDDQLAVDDADGLDDVHV